MPKRKAAVVIGVNKTGNLTPLNSAAAGAESVATWLTDEGYEVECLTDKNGPITANNVQDAIFKFATVPPRFHLLLIYFSGHGYWQARADHWLLSGAPVRNNEAINLSGAMDLARFSGIPNVVFISDACRSIPDVRANAFVKGIDAFPNHSEIDTISKIDVFKATSDAQAAYEGTIDGQSHSMLTYAMMSAFTEPEDTMVKEIQDGQQKITVVPNRQLEDYVQKKINKLLSKIDQNLSQKIEVNVPSDDDVYIARVRGSVKSTAPTAGIEELPVHKDVIRTINDTLFEGPITPRFETQQELELRIPSTTVDHFETGVGFTVTGAKVVQAVCSKGQGNAEVELLEEGNLDDVPSIIRLNDVHPAVSVALRFDDGRSTLLPALNGYLGHVFVNEEGVSGVSYVPSSNNWRWGSYEQNKDKIDHFRALVQLAVEQNTFNVGSSEEAQRLASKIRMEKSIDPTLGLYAAHAYSQAGKDDQVIDVLHYMKNDLNADLFDVRLLASRNLSLMSSGVPLVPCCPILTQTWNLLSSRQMELTDVLKNAGKYLCNSLWTTFLPEVTDSIINAIEKGELQ